MKNLKLEDVNWNNVFDMADARLKAYNIPHKVSRYQKQIYLNRPLCFVILPYSWSESIFNELRAVPGVMEMQAFNTENGRYRKFAIYT